MKAKKTSHSIQIFKNGGIKYGLILLFFMVTVRGTAQQKGEFRAAVFNDSWGGGFTEIYDDLRTFHAKLDYEKKEKFKLSAVYSLLTNRYDDETEQRKLLDELIVNGAIPVIRFGHGKRGALWINGGFAVSGDLIGSKIQNLAHKLFGVPKDNLDYYYKLKFHPSLGYRANLHVWSKTLKNGKRLRFDVNQSTEYYYNYLFRTGIRGTLSLNTGTSQISFTPSYYLSKSYLKENNLLPNVLKAESGLGLGFKATGKNLYYRFAIFPFNGFSYGGIGIRLNGNPENPAEKSNPFNIWIDVGVVSNEYGYNFKYLFSLNNFSLFSRSLKIVVNHNFHTLLKTFIPDYPEKNGHANQLTVGLEVNLLNPAKPHLFDPYLNLSAGDKMISIYSKTVNLQKQTSHHFIINNDAGLYFHLPLKIKEQTKLLTLSFYYRTMILFSLTPAKESEFINGNNSPYRRYQHALGLGLSFKI